MIVLELLSALEDQELKFFGAIAMADVDVGRCVSKEWQCQMPQWLMMLQHARCHTQRNQDR